MVSIKLEDESVIDKLEIENQIVYFKSSEKMMEINDNSVTFIITSPPYWNVRDYGGNQIGLGQTYRDYINSLNKVWKECLRVLQPNGKISINVQPLPISSESSGFNFRVIYNIMNDIEQFFRKNNCFLSGMHYWDKSNFINNVAWGSYPRPTNISSNTSFEQIFTFVKAGKTRKIKKNLLENNLLQKEEWLHWAVRCIWDDITPVIKINQKKENLFGHSAPFPEEIPYRLIKMHTIEGETVLDPFLGSGTTLKITRLTNRKGIGYEINSDYRNLIIKRIKEEWKPQIIESGYRTIGYDTLNQIFKVIIQEVESKANCVLNEEETLQEITMILLKRGFLTKAQQKKILKKYLLE
ncbi:MAG TPA: site-specific DNA-methyltransferase [candidate division Zixibacteria bacterium]|nr:site-specific DNA-methyltransferase [candidate division Zixibacteria bacterium]